MKTLKNWISVLALTGIIGVTGVSLTACEEQPPAPPPAEPLPEPVPDPLNPMPTPQPVPEPEPMTPEQPGS